MGKHLLGSHLRFIEIGVDHIIDHRKACLKVTALVVDYAKYRVQLLAIFFNLLAKFIFKVIFEIKEERIYFALKKFEDAAFVTGGQAKANFF